METTDLLKSQLEVDTVATSHLAETAKWGKFLSIIGFIFCGLFVLLGIFISVAMSSFGGLYGGVFSGMGPVLGVIYILLALIYFAPCLFLFRFSNKMKLALNANDQETLNEAFNQHRRLYKFMGIFTIVILSIYAIFIVFAIVASAFR